MAEEAVDLGLVMDVPNAHDSVLAARHQVLAVGRDGSAEDFIVVALVLAIELLSSEEELGLRFEVPYGT